MTEEKLNAATALFIKIKRMNMLSENEISADEEYYKEVIGLIADKRKKKIEELKKQFEEL